MKAKVLELRSQHATIKDFMLCNNPSRQMVLCRSPNYCYFGNSPTLSYLKLAYGSTAAELWLVPQLKSISDYCGLKEKVSEEQLLELATIIATHYHWLKTDELILFFAFFKAAKYERKSPNIPCYALRHKFGLTISSNRVGKENDLIVASRQKHNGMAWSDKGSGALSIIKAALHNKELKTWITTKKIQFKMCA